MVSTNKLEAAGELLCPIPSVVPALSAVRGTILLLDWRWLRENALFADYERALADRALLATVATDWVAIEAALNHWRAIDSLKLLPRDRRGRRARLVHDAGVLAVGLLTGLFSAPRGARDSARSTPSRS